MDVTNPGAHLEQPRQDNNLVKCVVIGDTGVGKTRLVCAHACGTKYSLHQMMQTHGSTVWAIDHYRKDPEVLERSWMLVDGFKIFLQLWDTFGYHDKDRMFAYGSADVVLVCYSAVRQKTLKSVLNHWYPEIQRLCPGVPIVLCGCQADLRYLYQDQDFINLEKSPFYKEIVEAEIVTPEQGRKVAKDIGAYYYETSVLFGYGIEDVFLNVIRAAIIPKWGRHFWTRFGNLKRITKPMCQAPIDPPQSNAPDCKVPKDCIENDMRNLLQSGSYCDVNFITHGVTIPAHRVCLLAASAMFEELFLSDILTMNLNATSSKMMTMQPVSKSPVREPSQADTAYLLEEEESPRGGRTFSLSDTPSSSETSLPPCHLNHRAFKSFAVSHVPDEYDPNTKQLRMVIFLDDAITPMAFHCILDYLYSGKFVRRKNTDLGEICRAADILDLRELLQVVVNVMHGEEYLNTNVLLMFHHLRCERLRDLVIKQGILSDVLFQLDDDTVPAHKALLSARCAMMQGMFSYNFRERSAKVIPFPGISRASFLILQEYLYTGTVSAFNDADYLELIEMANRMCQLRLLALVEKHVIQELTDSEAANKDILEDVLALLEPSQLHNATQLAAWCSWYLANHYRTLYRKHKKQLYSLRPDNQAALNKTRWPPLWYIKEQDYYEKCLIDLERQGSSKKYSLATVTRATVAEADDNDGGCLGFCGRNRRRLRCSAGTSHATTVVN